MEGEETDSGIDTGVRGIQDQEDNQYFSVNSYTSFIIQRQALTEIFCRSWTSAFLLFIIITDMTHWFQNPIFNYFRRHNKVHVSSNNSINNNVSDEPQKEKKVKMKPALASFVKNPDFILPPVNTSACNQRRILVMVNPASGSGRAASIYRDYVYPLLTDAELKVTLFVTASNGSAKEFIAGHDLKANFDGIVIISGDGLIFEVINGLMKRPDCDEVIKLPIGIIPGGSGNGLAFSILHALGDVCNNNNSAILTSTLNVMHGKKTPLDLIEVRTTKSVYYSFLSIGWGLLADMDIESERLRFLGGFRFSVWGVVRSVGLRKYRGRLSYLPVLGWINKSNGTSLPMTASTERTTKSIHYHETTSDKTEIPSLYDPLPSSWVSIEDDFIMVYSGHVSHMAANCFLAPNSRLDDGIIWLLYLTGNLSRCQVVQFLIALDSGKHINLPYVSLLPVQAFRLEPLNAASRGVMTIDGELIESGPLQAHVLPSVANIMSR